MHMHQSTLYYNMTLLKLFPYKTVLKSSDYLLRVRLWFFIVAWVHISVVGIMFLQVDMSRDEDPNIAKYATLKWRFITMWFNLINVAYMPLCIYCDWREIRGDVLIKHAKILRQIRDVVQTSILFPTILFADTLFWRLYHKDASLICPIALFDYLPYWGQHSLHTVSLIVVVLDLLLVPRQRPASLRPGLAVMTTFFAVYVVVVFESFIRGDIVYRALAILSGRNIILFMVMSYTECLFYFTVQWFIIDYVWHNYKDTKKINQINK